MSIKDRTISCLKTSNVNINKIVHFGSSFFVFGAMDKITANNQSLSGSKPINRILIRNITIRIIQLKKSVQFNVINDPIRFNTIMCKI